MTTSLKCSFWLALVGTAWLAGPAFAEGVKGRPIEFSEPRSERGKTDDNKLTPGQTRLGQWENELNRPFQGLTPGKSLDGMILSTPLPMPPPAVQIPRARELNDKKRDWMFLSPEEMFAIKTIEDKYKAPELTPDGRDRAGIRPMERAYLDAVDAARSALGTNQGFALPNGAMDPGLGSLLPGAGATLGNPFSSQLNQTGTEAQRSLGWSPGMGSTRSTDAADFFKFNNGYKAPTKPTEAELQRAQDFRQIYDFGNAQPIEIGTKADHMFSSPYVDPSFFAPPKPATPAPVATLGGGLSGSSLDAGSSLGWAPTISPPAPEPTRNLMQPSSPFMNVPRRGY